MRTRENDMTLKKNLDDVVYENICNGFVGGNYVAGMRLDPAELAQNYQVSRTPVVQALKRMSNEHILDVTKGGKYLIPEVNEEIVEDISEARLLIEENALCTLCDRITDDQLIVLQHIADKAAKYLEQEDYDSYFIEDLKFHRRCVKFAENEVLYSLFEILMNRYMVMRATGKIHLKHDKEASIEHISLVEAVRQKSKKEVKNIIRRHIGKIEYRSQ